MTTLGIGIALALSQPIPATTITAVAFRPDGRVVAAAGWDETISVYLVPEGRLLRQHRGHQEHITSLAYSPDGNTLISGSADGRIGLWAGDREHTIGFVRAGTDYVSGVGFHPNGREFYAAGYDNRIKAWSWPSRSGPRVALQLDSDAYGMAASSQGTLAGFGPVFDPGKTAFKWTETVARRALPPVVIDEDLTEGAFSADGHHLAAVSLRGAVYLISRDGNHRTIPVARPEDIAYVAAPTPGWVVATYEGWIHGLTLDGSPGDRWQVSGNPTSVAAHPSQPWAVFGTDQGGVTLIDLTTGETTSFTRPR